jgi:hypothetical protein
MDESVHGVGGTVGSKVIASWYHGSRENERCLFQYYKNKVEQEH